MSTEQSAGTPAAPVDPKTFRRVALPVWKVATRVLFLLFCAPLRRRGGRPPEGGCLVLCNHLADIDPFVVMGTSPRPIRFMGKSDLFSMPVVGWGLRYWGVFAVRRGESDRAALKLAAELVKEGWAVGVFPEGELSESGSLMEIKPGVSLIARLAIPADDPARGCPVVCCAIQNTNRILPYGKVIPRPGFCFLQANWGEPRVFTKEDAADLPAWCEAELRRLGAP